MNLIKRIFGATATQKPAPATGAGFFGPTVTGLQVTEASAMNYAAVWACVKIISETIAVLPWRVIQANGQFREPLNDHPLAELLSVAANGEVDAMTWRESAARDALLWGNHYSEIEYNNRGDAIAFWRLNPEYVTATRGDDGKIIYEVREAGNVVKLPPDRVLHVKGPSADGLTGLSTVRYARESIGLGLAVERFGSAFFGNGAQLSGIIQNKTGGLSEEAVKNLLQSFNRRHGGVNNAHKVGYLDGDMEFKTIGVPPEDAQFLQSRKFNILDVCRWFRVPPHKLAELERSTHSNIEHQNIEFVTDAILPWVRRFESAVNFKLLRGNSGVSTKLTVNGLLRGDSNARAAYYNQLFQMGVLSPNQIAALEDLPPVPDGDAHYVQLNMAPTTGAGMEQSAELSVREVADAYTRTAANALKRVKTAEQMQQYTAGQKALFLNFFRPVARFFTADDRLNAVAELWAGDLVAFMSGHASATIEDGAEALRAWAPGHIVELFRETVSQ